MDKIAKTTFFLTLLMALSKVISFARDLCLSYKYGASGVSDAYLVAVSISTILFTGLFVALFTCYIPVYNEIKKNNSKHEKPFNSNIVNVVLILSAVIVVVYWIFSDKIMVIFAAGFEEETFQLAQNMTNIMVLSIIFMGVSYVLQGYLQANGSYYLIGFMTIPVNVIMAVAVLLSNEDKLGIMMWGTVVAYAIYIPYFGVPAFKKGFRYQPYLNLKDESLKKLMHMLLPMFVGQMILEINVIVDKNLASGLPAGTITAMDYAHKVSALVYASVANPMATAVYPKFSFYATDGSIQELKKLVISCMKVVAILVVPLVVCMCVLARPVVEMLFFRGAFSENAVSRTVECLICYALGVLPISFRVIMEKVLYSFQETRQPMINSAIGIGVNIVLNLILVRFFAHSGLAIATSIASLVTSSLFYLKMKRKIGNLNGKEIALVTTKAIVAGVGMGGFVWFLNSRILCFLETTTLLLMVRVVVCAVSGCFVYILLLYFLRLKELDMIRDFIYNKLRRRVK